MCSFTFQSKEIGLQMHEELLKVTNELYTVSPAQLCCRVRPGPFLQCPGLEGGYPEVWEDPESFLLCAQETVGHYGVM